MRMPWPVVHDAFLAALALQVVLAVLAQFVGFLGRHFGVSSAIISALMGFIFGVWSNPTPPLVSGLGGAIVTGGSALAGGVIVYFLKDGKAGSLLWLVLIAAVAGMIFGAAGSFAGRSVFGS